jgi:signal transduction histidine kinase
MMNRTLRHNRKLSPGRRGGFLLLFGALYVLLGYSYMGSRPTDAVRTSLAVAEQLMPLWGYGLLWMAAGLVALVSGLVFSPARDALGFGAAILMPTLWSGTYFLAWLHGDSDRGWVTAVIFAIIAAAVAIVSGMVNPSVLLPQDDQP